MSRIIIKLRLMRMRDMLEYHNTLNKIVKRACDLEELPSVWLDRAIKELEDEPTPTSTFTVNHERAEEYLKATNESTEWFENFTKQIKESGK